MSKSSSLSNRRGSLFPRVAAARQSSPAALTATATSVNALNYSLQGHEVPVTLFNNDRIQRNGEFRSSSNMSPTSSFHKPIGILQKDEISDKGNDSFGFNIEDLSMESVNVETSYRTLVGKQRWALTIEAFTLNEINDKGRQRSKRVAYIEGLRGILAFQTLLWIFFRTFAPAIVVDTDLDGTFPASFVINAPNWMNLLRKILSPILFDGQVIAAMYVILIGRTSLFTFIERRQAICLAGACVRRPIRILLPIAMALTLVSILIVSNGFKYAPEMATNLQNMAINPPAIWSNALEYFNSVLALVYSPYSQKDSRAVEFLPIGRIAWFIEIAFQQIYVLVIFAFALPFTIFKYKVIGFGMMILLSAWVARWSWYTVTGLVLAEFAVVYRGSLPDRASKATVQRGQRRLSLTPPKHNPIRDTLFWLVPTAMLCIGLIFRYVWIAGVPKYQNKEILAHADLNTADIFRNYNTVSQAYPRYDAWLLCTGLLFLIELSEKSQRILSNSILIWFGRLGFSIALISGTIMTSLGALLHHYLIFSKGMKDPGMVLFLEFLAMIPINLIAVDIWSRLIDDSSLFLSRAVFQFAIS